MASVVASGGEVGRRGGWRGQRDRRRHPEPGGAQRRVGPAPLAAAPSSSASTASATCEPCAVPSSERSCAPHAGLTTRVCSTACAPTNPKPKRLPSQPMLVDAAPKNGIPTCASAAVSRASLTAGTTANTDAGRSAIGDCRPRPSTRSVRPATPPRALARAKRACAPMSAPAEPGSAATMPPTATVVRVTPSTAWTATVVDDAIVVVGGSAPRAGVATNASPPTSVAANATRILRPARNELLHRHDAAARVGHLHRVRGAVARHERAARRRRGVRGGEAWSGPTVSATS